MPRSTRKVSVSTHLDKRHAVAQVKVQDKTFLRAINLLYPLAVNSSNSKNSNANDIPDNDQPTAAK